MRLVEAVQQRLARTCFTRDSREHLVVLRPVRAGDLLVLVQDTTRTRYTPADVKAWMMMMMRGVWFCHQNFILHRDIKPNNLLIAANGEIKLADFGLARSFADPYAEMTSQVITSWYRPPELFFRARYYGGAVDIWSCGCVFAELINRAVFLMGIPPDNELNMVRQICENVGTPTEENWPGVTKLRSYVTPEEVIPIRSRSSWIEQFRTIGEDGVDLLIAMMQLDPNKRLTAEGVLKHKYFTSIPRPTPLGELPKKGGGVEAMGEELKRRGGEIPGEDSNGDGRGDRVARKIDFGGM